MKCHHMEVQERLDFDLKKPGSLLRFHGHLLGLEWRGDFHLEIFGELFEGEVEMDLNVSKIEVQ